MTKKYWMIVAISMAIGIAAAVALFGGSGSSKPPTSAQIEAMQVKAGDVAPVSFLDHNGLKGTGFDGGERTIAGPHLIVFAAHWCPHCQRELPLLAQWKSPIPMTFVSTATIIHGDNYPAKAWFERLGITEVIRDDFAKDALNHYGLTGFPGFVLLRADGTTVTRSGEVSMAELEQWINDHLAG